MSSALLIFLAVIMGFIGGWFLHSYIMYRQHKARPARVCRLEKTSLCHTCARDSFLKLIFDLHPESMIGCSAACTH